MIKMRLKKVNVDVGIKEEIKIRFLSDSKDFICNGTYGEACDGI